jgi:hypothetical protein
VPATPNANSDTLSVCGLCALDHWAETRQRFGFARRRQTTERLDLLLRSERNAGGVVAGSLLATSTFYEGPSWRGAGRNGSML